MALPLLSRRFVALDALRGVAALTIVAYHYAQHVGGVRIVHGYLAVDLFFMLSGFVLARANDGRFASGAQTWRTFMLGRLRRLAPLYALGCVLGLASLILGVRPEIHGCRILAVFVVNALGAPSFFPGKDGALFPLNDPFWSLFFEVWIANLIFCLFWRRLQGGLLVAVIAVSGMLFVAWAEVFHDFGAGWGTASFFGGFPRVLYTFFLGVWLARAHLRSPWRRAAPPIVIILGFILIVAAPISGHLVSSLLNLLTIGVVFPACIYFGAATAQGESRMGRWLGDASYAVYVIHFPMVMVLARAAGSAPFLGTVLFQAVFVMAAFLAALIAARADEAFRDRFLKHAGLGAAA